VRLTLCKQAQGVVGGRGRRLWASDWFEAWAWQRPGAARGPTQWPQRPATERACPGVSLLRRRPKCLRGAPSARRSRGLGRGCHQARADLQPEQTFVVIPGDGGYPLADGVPDLATPGIQRPRPGRPKPAPEGQHQEEQPKPQQKQPSTQSRTARRQLLNVSRSTPPIPALVSLIGLTLHAFTLLAHLGLIPLLCSLRLQNTLIVFHFLQTFTRRILFD